MFAAPDADFARNQIYRDVPIPIGVRVSCDRWEVETNELYIVEDPGIQQSDHASLFDTRPGEVNCFVAFAFNRLLLHSACPNSNSSASGLQTRSRQLSSECAELSGWC